jgi:GTPase SAR1 family protein
MFVVAGDITRTEYQALSELQAGCKPLILVFNKTDLYPNQVSQHRECLGSGVNGFS